MTRNMLRGTVLDFISNAKASALPLFALLAVPIVAAIGAAVDYSRATAVRAQMQAQIDSALLAGAKDASGGWNEIALNIFNASPQAARRHHQSAELRGRRKREIYGYRDRIGADQRPRRARNQLDCGQRHLGRRAGQRHRYLLHPDARSRPIHSGRIADARRRTGPVVDRMRDWSNTSMNCNGHNGNATSSIAAGTVSNCSNGQGRALVVPDIYWDLAAKNITFKCPGHGHRSGSPGMGAPQAARRADRVNQSYGIEYHVCADLTLTGHRRYYRQRAEHRHGYRDRERQSEHRDRRRREDDARHDHPDGEQYGSERDQFSQRQGDTGTLSVSPPTNAANPWQGISVYQDPILTNSVDNVWGVGDSWGPGAIFNADGVVYLPRSNVTFHGSGASNNSKCTKFVVNTFTTDGSTNLNFYSRTAAPASASISGRPSRSIWRGEIAARETVSRRPCLTNVRSTAKSGAKSGHSPRGSKLPTGWGTDVAGSGVLLHQSAATPRSFFQVAVLVPTGPFRPG